MLWRYLRPQRWRVALSAILLLTTLGLELYAPLILGGFIDGARAGQALSELYGAALTFLGLIVAAQLVSVATTYQAEIIGWTATNALRHDLTAHLLDLDLGFHQDHSAGELIERVDGDVGALHHFFAQFLIRIVGNALLLLGLLIIVLVQHWQVGLTLGLFSFFVGASLFRLRHLAVEAILADRQLNARLNGFWEERLVASADLRGNGAVEHVLQSQQPLNWQALQLTRKGRNLGWTVHGVYIGLHIIGSALIFAVAASLYLRGQATLGSVYLVFHYLGLVVINLRGFVRELDTLQRATASLRRVEALFARQNRLPAPAKAAAAPPPVDDVLLSFADVTFAYEDRPVLHNLSFNLAPGEKLALLGRTGSGKSTLARLVFRFYDPQAGQISLHGRPLPQWPLSELRGRIGLVTQNVELFSATVRDNVTLFDRRIRDAQIGAALANLGLGAWLAALPAGLDTRLGSGGLGLSAGEAQLLALARLFLQDPALIILDEASARLDPISEARLEIALTQLLAGRAAIIIAHR
ncbi:MAG: ABC transporter ATP-binding protein, partial [Anaerolineales bacterium]|nr:ABC transporter ATP-binding protein [Anaerolineales bacterium]